MLLASNNDRHPEGVTPAASFSEAAAGVRCGGHSGGVRTGLPTGEITLVFTDIEGSTRMLHELGARAYAGVLAEHRQVLRAAFTAHGGVEVDTQGDALFVAFPTAAGALAAAAEATAALATGPVRVRMGVHTGVPLLGDEGYVGEDVHRAARIAACGHGGQVLVSAASAGAAGATGLRDLGEHRLKDLSAPERIFQLGHGEFPPLRSLYRSNLPVPATPFLGRENELGEIAALLADPEVRLLTLTGPGGTGKTRLAQQAAALVADDYPAGAWWVPLAAVRDPRLVLDTAASVVGATGDLADAIADRTMLLVLDNLEQVVEAAADVAALLARCPNLTVLTSSRERLRVPVERTYLVPAMAAEEAIALFLARGRANDATLAPDAVVTELCRRLENLPLALELAAARVGVLTPAQLLDRLGRRLDLLKAGRGVDPRQQTLRATLEWSHDLLDAEEQQLFARLATFSGGWTLEAAEAVCDADLDVLESLLDKSLVARRDHDRFAMLETVREFALERFHGLGASATATTVERHARHFLAVAVQAKPHADAQDKDWLDRLDRDHPNLRAALDHLTGAGRAQDVMAMTAALTEFWSLRGHWAEQERRLLAALDLDPVPTLARAEVLAAVADILSDDARRVTTAEEALAIARGLGDRRIEGLALLALGSAAEVDDWARAHTMWAAAVEAFRDGGDEHQRLHALRLQAWSRLELGDAEGSRALDAQGLAEARAAGDAVMEARFLEGAATRLRSERRFDEALEALGQAYTAYTAVSDPFRTAVCLNRMATVLSMAGEAADGARVHACAAALLEDLGAASVRWVADLLAQARAEAAGRLPAAALTAALAQGAELSPDEALSLVSRARRSS